MRKHSIQTSHMHQTLPLLQAKGHSTAWKLQRHPVEMPAMTRITLHAYTIKHFYNRINKSSCKLILSLLLKSQLQFQLLSALMWVEEADYHIKGFLYSLVCHSTFRQLCTKFELRLILNSPAKRGHSLCGITFNLSLTCGCAIGISDTAT